ncbi:hypothetical protein PR048_013920 [Dryococelus australis]|uniref:Uncharacterized protein n=1 Tax=Dryococelus australis TaxID=614101 RepID=A0ABQ9HTI3_9NEOP|nr:hypothetical protein PR048_013920 [Dryococelus australis]
MVPIAASDITAETSLQSTEMAPIASSDIAAETSLRSTQMAPIVAPDISTETSLRCTQTAHIAASDLAVDTSLRSTVMVPIAASDITAETSLQSTEMAPIASSDIAAETSLRSTEITPIAASDLAVDTSLRSNVMVPIAASDITAETSLQSTEMAPIAASNIAAETSLRSTQMAPIVAPDISTETSVRHRGGDVQTVPFEATPDRSTQTVPFPAAASFQGPQLQPFRGFQTGELTTCDNTITVGSVLLEAVSIPQRERYSSFEEEEEEEEMNIFLASLHGHVRGDILECCFSGLNLSPERASSSREDLVRNLGLEPKCTSHAYSLQLKAQSRNPCLFALHQYRQADERNNHGSRASGAPLLATHVNKEMVVARSSLLLLMREINTPAGALCECREKQDGMRESSAKPAALLVGLEDIGLWIPVFDCARRLELLLVEEWRSSKIGATDSLLASRQGEPGSIPTDSLRMWESCRTMPLARGFSRGFPVSPPFHNGTTSYSPQSPPSALKTSLLRAAQNSSLTLARRGRVSSCNGRTLIYHLGEPGLIPGGVNPRVFTRSPSLRSSNAPYSPRFALVGSQHSDVKIRPNPCTHPGKLMRSAVLGKRTRVFPSLARKKRSRYDLLIGIGHLKGRFGEASTGSTGNFVTLMEQLEQVMKYTPYSRLKAMDTLPALRRSRPQVHRIRVMIRQRDERVAELQGSPQTFKTDLTEVALRRLYVNQHVLRRDPAGDVAFDAAVTVAPNRSLAHVRKTAAEDVLEELYPFTEAIKQGMISESLTKTRFRRKDATEWGYLGDEG